MSVKVQLLRFDLTGEDENVASLFLSVQELHGNLRFRESRLEGDFIAINLTVAVFAVNWRTGERRMIWMPDVGAVSQS